MDTHTVVTYEVIEPVSNKRFAAAEKLAREVIDRKLPNEDRLAGAAHHILADIAFRREEKTLCRSEAEAARACYVRTGTLSGVEAVERLLGMLETTDRTAALKHLSISNALSEVLREQVPADQIGLSRAGFFARRAYVNERLIELFLQEGKNVEALTILEAAKGRALTDVLTGAGIRSGSGETADIRSVEEILAGLPKDISRLLLWWSNKIKTTIPKRCRCRYSSWMNRSMFFRCRRSLFGIRCTGVKIDRSIRLRW